MTLICRRQFFGVLKLAHRSYSNSALDAATQQTPTDLSANERATLDAALRVDQAGEIAANWIYRGQYFVLGNDVKAGPLIREMWEQEKKHIAVMDQLQLQHRIRPTILSEVAKIAGFGLGAATALISKEAAMACTEAVETEIGEHYDDQLRDLEAFKTEHPSIPLLQAVLREFRDDELEHLDTAVQNDAQRAPAHALLSSAIGAGLCKRF
ncbi:ubiquinone biosynthesis protein COQ7-domain-containing protein [Flagelloscypha sp. PMI_526]|nr:ubiquinone biosynthesis protein COQ7-domain-containing protein [Flagelloscypha sp. PMI_526]